MNVANSFREAVRSSLERAIDWVRAHEYRAYEPADGNLTWLFSLTGGRVFPMRILQQVVLRAPINIRPLLGIAPHESAIGLGYMAWSYVILFRLSHDETFRRDAVGCLRWLIANRSPHSPEFCWGDPYEYATRGGRRAYGQPLLIWSSLIGSAFLDAYEAFNDPQYLQVAESIGRWVLKLPSEHTSAGSCLSYVAYRQSSIHNSNAMGAAFLARLGMLTHDEEALKVAASAMTYTCSRQRADGSWYYAEESKYHWIDNFHTGYNLSAIHAYQNATGERSFEAVLRKGMQYYTSHFFEEDGRPKYFHDATYPVDIQCAAQAIETLATLCADDAANLALACKVAEWTIRNMQAKDGHFYYRDLGWKKVTTPMLHWGQGTMIKALATLLKQLET